MPFLLAHPSSQEAIHQFLDANDISYENQHQDFINHLHKAAHALQHPQYRGSRDTWEHKFFSEVRRDHNGVSTDVYLEALKEWLKGYKPGNGPELKGSISALGDGAHVQGQERLKSLLLGSNTSRKGRRQTKRQARAAYALIEDPIDDATLGLQDAISTIEKGEDFEGEEEVDGEEEMEEKTAPVSFGNMVFR